MKFKIIRKSDALPDTFINFGNMPSSNGGYKSILKGGEIVNRLMKDEERSYMITVPEGKREFTIDFDTESNTGKTFFQAVISHPNIRHEFNKDVQKNVLYELVSLQAEVSSAVDRIKYLYSIMSKIINMNVASRTEIGFYINLPMSERQSDGTLKLKSAEQVFIDLLQPRIVAKKKFNETVYEDNALYIVHADAISKFFVDEDASMKAMINKAIVCGVIKKNHNLNYVTAIDESVVLGTKVEDVILYCKENKAFYEKTLIPHVNDKNLLSESETEGFDKVESVDGIENKKKVDFKQEPLEILQAKAKVHNSSLPVNNYKDKQKLWAIIEKGEAKWQKDGIDAESFYREKGIIA